MAANNSGQLPEKTSSTYVRQIVPWLPSGLRSIGTPTRFVEMARLYVPTGFIGIAQKGNLALLVTKQDVLHRMTLFLAALVRFLLNIVVRMSDQSFSAIVINRGAVSSWPCCSV
jgi:hypothetical protein